MSVVVKERKDTQSGWKEFQQIPFKYSYTIGIRALHLEQVSLYLFKLCVFLYNVIFGKS